MAINIPLSVDLVNVLVALRRQISDDLRAQARLHIADSIGIAFAAYAQPAEVRATLAAMSAGSEGSACHVIAGTQRLPPQAAAFVNSALIHIADFDSVHDEARLHPTTVTLPAALAAAEVIGARGDAMLSATLLGNELMCRLGTACAPQGAGPGSDWFLTQLFGYFGAAVAAGAVLNLTAEQLVSALGFAYMQAAGGKEAGFGVGSNARSIYPAFAAQGGLTAALLARAGLIGPSTALDGAAGLFRIYLGSDLKPSSRARLLDPAHWEFAATSIKPWPSCRLSHPYVAAALAVREAVQQQSVTRLILAVNASAAKLCRPLEQRIRPNTLQDAKYSLPFMTAFALVHGRVDLDNLNERSLNDRVVLELAARVEIDERLPDRPGHPPAELAVETAQGIFESPKVQSSSFEMDAIQTRDKFLRCLEYVGCAEQSAIQLWHQLMRVEELSVGELLSSIPSPQLGTGP